MTKEHILAEIRRTAAENGAPLGKSRFLSGTGIKEADWYGKYWTRWNDAVREAGFAPNAFTVAIPDEVLLESLQQLVQRLGHFPIIAELRMEARSNPDFPDPSVLKRFGAKADIAARLEAFCRERGDEAVVTICAPIAARRPTTAQEELTGNVEFGFVYLMKSGRFYKLGRTNAVGRRERELALQLREKVRQVHAIKTDDPAGIEDYWHRRFDARRKNGEWFELTAADVAAFRRRKFM